MNSRTIHLFTAALCAMGLSGCYAGYPFHWGMLRGTGMATFCSCRG